MASAGFDTGSYPGDTAMKTWAASSPYQFVGYYLDAPCHTPHTFTSWMGKRHFLTGLGLGLAVVYVGLQQEGCGSTHLSHAKGLEHGADTIAKCRGEGFPAGTIVFLDVESFDGSMSADMQLYYRGWVSAILDSHDVKVGTYCAKKNVHDVLLAARAEYAAHGQPGGAPSLWIVSVGDPLFDPATSSPADSGVASADVWQGRIDIQDETHGGVSLDIDQNVATSRDPSHTFGVVTT